MFSIFKLAVKAIPLCVLCTATVVGAQAVSDAELQRRQAQQNEQTQNRVNATPDVFTAPKVDRAALVLPDEKPCFTITRIEWRDAEQFGWLTTEDAALRNRCIGAKGLRAIQDHFTRKLLEKGYVTSRILIAEQNLSGGHLVLQLVPGRISAVRDRGDAIGWHRMALPAHEGELLNQRDLDQALENIRRVSGQQAVEFDLVPGANPGDTELVIKHPASKRWHGLITLDDSGADATGKYQLGGTLIIDSPLHLYDTLAITLNNNANYRNDSLGTRATSINWNMPIGYWSVFLSANQSTYKQTVAGFAGDITYSGRSRGIEIGTSYVAYRNADAKGAFQFKLTRRASRSDIDDTEIEVQRRDVVGYETGFSHRQYIGQVTLDLGVGLRGSIPKYSAAPGLIIGAPDWDGRYQIQVANAGVLVPFKLATQNLRYQGSWRIQHATTPLPQTEHFSIGNRYSVRGFDGMATLAAEDGWLLRNDVAWSIGQSNQEIFVGLDTGRVSGPSADLLLGRQLSGAALGMRGKLGQLSYEITAGWPISKPAGFRTQEPALTASLAFEF
jgi:hemolysin activation/secretion protein